MKHLWYPVLCWLLVLAMLSPLAGDSVTIRFTQTRTVSTKGVPIYTLSRQYNGSAYLGNQLTLPHRQWTENF